MTINNNYHAQEITPTDGLVKIFTTKTPQKFTLYKKVVNGNETFVWFTTATNSTQTKHTDHNQTFLGVGGRKEAHDAAIFYLSENPQDAEEFFRDSTMHEILVRVDRKTHSEPHPIDEEHSINEDRQSVNTEKGGAPNYEKVLYEIFQKMNDEYVKISKNMKNNNQPSSANKTAMDEVWKFFATTPNTVRDVHASNTSTSTHQNDLSDNGAANLISDFTEVFLDNISPQGVFDILSTYLSDNTKRGK